MTGSRLLLQPVSRVTIKHITRYGGGHTIDPGYATAWAILMHNDEERTFNFHCDHDGRRIRAIHTRRKDGKWVRVSYSTVNYWAELIEPAAIEAFAMPV